MWSVSASIYTQAPPPTVKTPRGNPGYTHSAHFFLRNQSLFLCALLHVHFVSKLGFKRVQLTLQDAHALNVTAYICTALQ
jgi:hypothetical protein